MPGKHWDNRYWHRLLMLASTVYEKENCRAVLYSNTFGTCLHLQFFLRISPFGGCEPVNQLEMFSRCINRTLRNIYRLFTG